MYFNIVNLSIFVIIDAIIYVLIFFCSLAMNSFLLFLRMMLFEVVIHVFEQQFKPIKVDDDKYRLVYMWS